MVIDSSKTKSPRIFGTLPEDLAERLTAAGQPAFRAKQVLDWLWAKRIADPARMTNLPPALRESLGQMLDVSRGTVVSEQHSADGTIKLLIRWPGNDAEAETVMIPDGPRRTACVSSQVGCPVGCRFCASGVNGVKGNLDAGQIVEQIFALDEILAKRGEKITNVVFMGMGEPLANYANVTRAIRVMNHPKCLNLGARRLTVSTVGVPSRIRELADEEIQLNLAFSLHAPNEPLRRELIPWADHFALHDILEAARYYFHRTGREITLEYILLAGVNDRPEHARELAELCRTLRANVNLLRYNEVEGLPFKRPDGDDVMAFQNVLREAGVNAHVRKSRGRDIDAACGQLRRQQAARDAAERQNADSPLVQLGAKD
ncbi:MAG: 23S rRNA (adenine(2503)-C(2))-methyltransferase RlmN [Phycisphaerae bacterium]